LHAVFEERRLRGRHRRPLGLGETGAAHAQQILAVRAALRGGGVDQETGARASPRQRAYDHLRVQGLHQPGDLHRLLGVALGRCQDELVPRQEAVLILGDLREEMGVIPWGDFA
jgi:hypothetical protein